MSGFITLYIIIMAKTRPTDQGEGPGEEEEKRGTGTNRESNWQENTTLCFYAFSKTSHQRRIRQLTKNNNKEKEIDR